MALLPPQPAPASHRAVALAALGIDGAAYAFYPAYWRFASHGSGGFLAGLDLVVLFLALWLVVAVASAIGLGRIRKWDAARDSVRFQARAFRFAFRFLVAFPALFIVALMILGNT
jgi:hypothetical protein